MMTPIGRAMFCRRRYAILAVGVMLFFAVLAWIFALRIAETGRTRDYVFAGLSLGAAVA